MNPNEKRVFRIGLVLCVLACLVAAPLVFAATRPVVPVVQADEPEAVLVARDAPVLAPVVFHDAHAVPEKASPAKPRPAAKKAHRAVDCSNAPKREIEVLAAGRVGETVLYCHD